MGKFKKLKTKTEDDLFLSLNHSKDIKYRIRVQEDKEAKEALLEELRIMEIEKLHKDYFDEDR